MLHGDRWTQNTLPIATGDAHVCQPCGETLEVRDYGRILVRIAQMGEFPMDASPCITQMGECPMDALPRIAQMGDLPMDALPRIAPAQEMPLMDLPWTLARTPATTNPATGSPNPPACQLGIKVLGAAL
jgi:hypothetical protein